jgi:non-ribosomal peptide synthase protein (TIGR01720 family)
MDGKLFVNALVQQGELVLNWVYSCDHYGEDIIRTLAAAYVANLEALISYCLEQGRSDIAYTPSDYGLNEQISYEELNSFLNADGPEMNNIMEF